MADANTGGAPQEMSAEQADATIASRAYVGMLVIVSIIGVIVALAAWCYLEGLYQIQRELFTHLPHALGYQNGPPKWWYLVVLGIAGVLVALAIKLLPGDGGHIPAKGLAAGGPASPRELPGVILAGLAAVGFGLVLGPEGPLIALGAGVAVLLIGLSGRDLPPQSLMVIAAAGSFTALAFIFASPLIAAVILIEATGLGGPRLRVVLIPGLLAAAIGTLVSIGLGSFTGLSNSAYALGPVDLQAIGHLKLGEFGWTIVFAIAVAVVTFGLMRGGMLTYGFVSRRRLIVLLPIAAPARRRDRDRLHAGLGQEHRLRALRRPGSAARARCAGGRVVDRDRRAAAGVQGDRLQLVARQLSWRPDVSGDLPGRRRRDPRLASPRLSGGRGRGRRDRRLGRWRAAASARIRPAGHAVDHESRGRRRAADRRRRRRGLRGDADALAGDAAGYSERRAIGDSG